MTERLTQEASAAASFVAVGAERSRAQALHRLESLGVTAERAQRAIEGIRSGARLTVNFHPDRLDSAGRTVAAGLLADGRYRSQFETGISNGGRTAVPGGDRTRWEATLFGGAYDRVPRNRDSGGSDPGAVLRPTYGALDVFHDPYGGSPRFGSSFLVLKASCFLRTTFCMGDSHLGPRDVGTIDQLLSVLAGALESCADGDGFGRGLSAEQFLSAANGGHQELPSARELDRYIEAQVHGPVDLALDVASVHVDPSFAGTDVYQDLQVVADRYGIDLLWTEGSEVAPDAIDPAFRGPEIASLANATVRGDGLVDAAAIGRALADRPYETPPPGGDDENSPLQRYKKLWHCCLRFGAAPQGPTY